MEGSAYVVREKLAELPSLVRESLPPPLLCGLGRVPARPFVDSFPLLLTNLRRQTDRKELAKETVKEISLAFQRAATEEDLATCTALILEESSPLFPLLQDRGAKLNDVQGEILRLFTVVTTRRGEHLPLNEAVRVRKTCVNFMVHDTSASRKLALHPIVGVLPALGTVPLLEGRSSELPDVPHEKDTTKR